MPEGDTVYRAAGRLREVLEGRRITAVRSFFAAIESAGLVGRRVERIETHGKHLFVHLHDGRALRVHLTHCSACGHRTRARSARSCSISA